MEPLTPQNQRVSQNKPKAEISKTQNPEDQQLRKAVNQNQQRKTTTQNTPQNLKQKHTNTKLNTLKAQPQSKCQPNLKTNTNPNPNQPRNRTQTHTQNANPKCRAVMPHQNSYSNHKTASHRTVRNKQLETSRKPKSTELKFSNSNPK